MLNEHIDQVHCSIEFYAIPATSAFEIFGKTYSVQYILHVKRRKAISGLTKTVQTQGRNLIQSCICLIQRKMISRGLMSYALVHNIIMLRQKQTENIDSKKDDALII